MLLGPLFEMTIFVIDGWTYGMMTVEEASPHRSLLQDEGDAFENIPSIQNSQDPTTFTEWKLTGWKVGVLTCATITGVVCLLNISLTACAVHNHHIADGLSYLYTGSCTDVANISLWIHLAINGMSTLLSASNYTMQVISSPTRRDVDAAHKRSKWLEIGVPSIRNLSSLPLGRVFMWLTLVLSSVPLHLMYNTAVFSTLSANNYNYIVTTENFSNSAPVYNSTAFGVSSEIINIMNETAANLSLVRYEPIDCRVAYNSVFLATIQSEHQLLYGRGFCGALQSELQLVNHDRCYFSKRVEICGHALNSMEVEQPAFANQCLSSKGDIMSGDWPSQGLKMWTPKRQFWLKAASGKRWHTCNLFLCLSWHRYAISSLNAVGTFNLKTIYELGYGTVNPKSLTNRTCPGLINTVIVANLPQAILSFLYMTYNGLFSCVVGADEWSRFAHSRKPLRVTFPKANNVRHIIFLFRTVMPYHFSSSPVFSIGSCRNQYFWL
ncbi:uncharacterized protein PAC_00001 [Phialocephala subalpina]|uniref:DUF6536 domain-containing protein n=1 Tax=Phialocephala subalpina TaxID=576137 RepID=A0A1L7WBT5_9HELO|nr:uncharacterized protein PAC_00001 [Phialocephala subalpina]